MKRASLLALLLISGTSAAFADNSRLPDGTQFPMWEKPLHFTKTYYVDTNAKNANDSGPGTKERPFRTIDHAAQVLQPGERVVIASGLYREPIRPARGGTSPDAMISYEAAPGADVVISGAAVTKGWEPSEGWNIGDDYETNQRVKAYQLHLQSPCIQQVRSVSCFPAKRSLHTPASITTRAFLSFGQGQYT